MKGKDCKLPIEQEFSNFLHNGKVEDQPKSRKMVVAAWFLLMITTIIITGFTFRALSEVSELREELENLKASIQLLHKKDSEFGTREHTEEQIGFLKDNYDDSDYNDDYYDISYEDEDKNEDLYDNNIFPNNVKKLLTGEGFTKDAKPTTTPPRPKRSIIGLTQEETIEELRRNSSKYGHTTSPPTTSSYHYPYYSLPKIRQDFNNYLATPKSTYFKKPNEQNFKKSAMLKSGVPYNSRENPDVETGVTNDGSTRSKHRQRRLEIEERPVRYGRMRPLPAAHFSGDTSKYVLGQHDNFDGNGRLRHPQRTFVDWVESDWFHTLEMGRHFSFSDGVLTIKEPGLYFIYAQIYYFDAHDTNGFRVYRNESDTLLQCTTMTHSMTHVLKSNTCYTAAAEYLHENDRISLGDLSDSRYSLFEPGKSFFGVIKLGDVKIVKRK